MSELFVQLSVMLLAVTGMVVLGILGARKGLRLVHRLSLVQRWAADPTGETSLNQGTKATDALITSLQAALTRAVADAQHQARATGAAALKTMAERVAHDIRSPLAALQMILADETLSAERRQLLSRIVNRINDIANVLITDHHPGAAPALEGASADGEVALLQAQGICSALDPIFTSMRIRNRTQQDWRLEIHKASDVHQLFVSLPASTLRALVEPVMRHGEEAVGRPGGLVVSLSGDAEQVHIGIAVQHQKPPWKLVSGMLPADIEALLEAHDVSLRAYPEGGVRLSLKRAAAPLWFLAQLEVCGADTVVICDDDDSIHLMWKERFAQLGLTEEGAGAPGAVVHLSSPEAFRTFMQHAPSHCLFLMDFELLGCRETGLSLIDEANLSRAVLVTSRADEAGLQSQCAQRQIKLLAKSRVPTLPIVVVPEPEKLHAVLIDDDPLIHDVWDFAAQTYDKRLRRFFAPADFFAVAARIHRESPIYLDYNLGEKVDADLVAREIAQLGFTEIYFATGYTAASLPAVPECVRQVVGKSPPTDWEELDPSAIDAALEAAFPPH